MTTLYYFRMSSKIYDGNDNERIPFPFYQVNNVIKYHLQYD